MAGEVTATRVFIQTRLTEGTALIDGDAFDDNDALRDGDIPGREGHLRFQLSTDPLFPDNEHTATTQPLHALPDDDYIVRYAFTDLQPNTTYYYRAVLGSIRDRTDQPDTDPGALHGTFTTLAGEGLAVPTRMHIVTGLNYDKFYAPNGYTQDDREAGYPACDAMLALEPDLLVFTGDDVYYDKPPHAQTREDMRAKWHRQFSRPRMIELLTNVATYWEKDDHDFRYNDCDLTTDRFPSVALGLTTFREQAPIVAQGDDESPTYRTHRVSQDLQVWLLEGRDDRDPNRDEDGSDKSLWGERQRDWLMRTLLESDATFKLLISPTPMLGPDGANKRDNHTNLDGFQHERDAFLDWAQTHGLWENGLYIVCGDRHWQYHTTHPSGAQEFSCGAICDANSRLGHNPAAPRAPTPTPS